MGKVISMQDFVAARASAARGAVAQAAVAVASAHEARETPKYAPAYCDPNNLHVGDRYEKGRDVKDIAKSIRKDIAEAIKCGSVPRIKTSVTIDRYSMGQSIDVKIKGVPDGFVVRNPEWIAAERRNECTLGISWMTDEARSVLETITSIAKRYHRDNSSSADDYYEVNFSLSVDFDHSL